MAETRTYHSLNVTTARADGGRICYVLLPGGLKDDGLKWMDAASVKFGCTIAVVTGMDWNSDLTPWAAPGMFKKEKDFGGNARMFLKHFLEDYIPNIEGVLNVRKPERAIVGVSLSGLFAVWSAFRTAEFARIASVSGSLWYDRFSSWMAENKVCGGVKKIHLSLGDREKNSREPRLAAVESATVEASRILSEQGVDVDFRMVPGTHFSPILPRLDMALESLYGTESGNE